MKHAALVAVAAAALGGCGFGSGGTHGTAKLWVTRDRGAHVVLVREVAAGQTAMEALRKVANVETSYGGRYVQAINGVSGSLSQQRDWLYYINGYEADRGAADYRLHPGDVEWWDYRSWKDELRVPIVVGAFPEPFLHGFEGKTRRAAVVYDAGKLRPQAKALAKLIGAASVSTRVFGEANVLFLTRTDVPLSARTKAAGAPVRFTLGPRAAKRLLADPDRVRFRYAGLW